MREYFLVALFVSSLWGWTNFKRGRARGDTPRQALLVATVGVIINTLIFPLSLCAWLYTKFTGRAILKCGPDGCRINRS